MKKISFIGGSITIFPDKLVIEEKAFFSPKKMTALPFRDIKDVSGQFDRLHLESSGGERFSLWFGSSGQMRMFMAKNEIKAAIKKAGV